MATKNEEVEVETDNSKSLKGFRKSKDLEDFYRFINENGLRREAHYALDYISSRLSKTKKKTRTRKAKKIH